MDTYLNLRDEKPELGEETPSASGGVVVLLEQHLEHLDRIPDQFAVHVVDGAGG